MGNDRWEGHRLEGAPGRVARLSPSHCAGTLTASVLLGTPLGFRLESFPVRVTQGINLPSTMPFRPIIAKRQLRLVFPDPFSRTALPPLRANLFYPASPLLLLDKGPRG